MKSVLTLTVALAITLCAQHVLAASNSSVVSLDEVTKLVGNHEAGMRAAESALAPIRSQSDLDEYLSMHSISPFGALSKRSLQLFVDSLVFTEHGLASYRTAEIESELTPRQAYAILSLFGVQQSLAQLRFHLGTPDELEALRNIGPIIDDDHPEYRCQPPATCITAMNTICIGQNCKGGNP